MHEPTTTIHRIEMCQFNQFRKDVHFHKKNPNKMSWPNTIIIQKEHEIDSAKTCVDHKFHDKINQKRKNL